MLCVGTGAYANRYIPHPVRLKETTIWTQHRTTEHGRHHNLLYKYLMSTLDVPYMLDNGFLVLDYWAGYYYWPPHLLYSKLDDIHLILSVHIYLLRSDINNRSLCSWCQLVCIIYIHYTTVNTRVTCIAINFIYAICISIIVIFTWLQWCDINLKKIFFFNTHPALSHQSNNIFFIYNAYRSLRELSESLYS